MNKSLFLYIFLCAILSISGNADSNLRAPGKNFLINYKLPKTESLNRTYRKFVYEGSHLTRLTPMVQKTLKKNPHVKSWNAIPKGTRIKLYLTRDYIDPVKFNHFLKSVTQRIKIQKLQLRRKMLLKKRKKFSKQKDVQRSEEKTSLDSLPEQAKINSSLFYMASFGSFNQKNNDIRNLDFLQNSPVTLGSALGVPLGKGPYSLSASGYFSYLVSAGSNLNSAETSIDPEIGINLYLERRMKSLGINPYFGFDYERFSSVNLNEILENENLIFDQHNVFFWTLGFSKVLRVFGAKLFTKLSASKTFSTSTSSPNKDTRTLGNYTGSKYMFYLNALLSKKVFVHTLFKYHEMSGPSQITSLRIGVGFGYILF